MKTAFKVGQRTHVLFIDCKGHESAKWLRRTEEVRKRHLRTCWYDATVRQVFAPDPLTEEPRYLIDNTYHVMAVEECALADYVEVPWLSRST